MDVPCSRSGCAPTAIRQNLHLHVRRGFFLRSGLSRLDGPVGGTTGCARGPSTLVVDVRGCAGIVERILEIKLPGLVYSLSVMLILSLGRREKWRSLPNLLNFSQR